MPRGPRGWHDPGVRSLGLSAACAHLASLGAAWLDTWKGPVDQALAPITQPLARGPVERGLVWIRHPDPWPNINRSLKVSSEHELLPLMCWTLTSALSKGLLQLIWEWTQKDFMSRAGEGPSKAHHGHMAPGNASLRILNSRGLTPTPDTGFMDELPHYHVLWSGLWDKEINL